MPYRSAELLKQAKERFPSARDIVIETIAFKASQEHYNELEPERAVWLAAVALIRHSLTEYDQLLLSGRGREEARAQVSSEVNRCLQDWGSVKYIQTQPQKIGLQGEPLTRQKHSPSPIKSMRVPARERLRFAEAAEREAEGTLDRARRAVERAERTRERIERELKEATEAERSALKEQAHAEKALEKATSERDRLQKKLRS